VVDLLHILNPKRRQAQSVTVIHSELDIMAVPTDLNLPERSPFFEKSAVNLRRIYVDGMHAPAPKSAKLNASVAKLVAANKADRAAMGIGLAILPNDGNPYFGGSNDDRLLSVASIAKLALLYASIQLLADVGVIGCSNGLADEGDYPQKVQDFVKGVQLAFRKSKDPELGRIASEDAIFPRLARIFDLKQFLQIKSKTRAPHMLAFNEFTGGGMVEPDDVGYKIRLISAVPSSDDLASAWCICDVGLPYIQALLARSGFGSLHGNKPGLWLSWFYASAQVVQKIRAGRKRRPPDKPLPDYLATLPEKYRDAITFDPNKLKMTDNTPELDKAHQSGFLSGHVATAVGLATFLTVLENRQLFRGDNYYTQEMLQYFSKGKWLASGFRGLGNGTFSEKVGYIEDPGSYSDCAIVRSTAIEQARSSPSAGSADAGVGGTTTWIPVALYATARTYNDGLAILTALGKDLETAAADNI